MDGKICVFAPHPDDEVLGCGGTIATRLKDGYDVSVVFLTDGRNSLRDIGVVSEPSPSELKELREEEARRSSRVLGIPQENLVFLRIEDGTLEKNEKLARAKIDELLKSSPEEVFFPQEREFNIDHRATNHLVQESIRRVGVHPLEYQYIIAWLYPLNILPRVHPEPLQNKIMSTILRRNVVCIDISDFLSSKKAALDEYQSQLSILSRKQKRPALKDTFVKRFLRNKEVFFVAKYK